MISQPPSILRAIPCLVEIILLFFLALLAPLAVLPGAAWLFPSSIALIAALSVIAFLPGYLLAILLFSSTPSISIYWLAALSSAASLAFIIFDGLLFNALGLPVTGIAMVAAQSGWSLLLLVLILLLPCRISPKVFLSSRLLSFWRASSLPLRAAALVCAFLALLFIGTLTSALFAPSNETFTELYISEPAALDTSSPTYDLSVTVVSHESTARHYTLTLTNGSANLHIPLFLEPDEEHTERISLSLDGMAPPELIQATLYLSGSFVPYRQIHLRLQKDGSQ